MPSPASFALFLAAAVPLILAPGPDTLYVLSRAVGQGRRYGVLSAFGVGTGLWVHITAAAVGLSALLRASALAFTVVRYAGAAYLVYLGIQALRSRDALHAQGARSAAPPLRIFAQAMATNVLNPKVALFFLAFLPQFVDPARGSVPLQIVQFGATYDVFGIAWLLAVAAASGTLGTLMLRKPRVARAQRWVTGGVMLALGLRLAVPDQR
ncbi:LysE family translocator [bacterium]|nr:MAG: LysE family translocator [bacterium]